MNSGIDVLDGRIVRLARMVALSPRSSLRLVKTRRIARHFPAYLRRRAVARDLTNCSQWAGFIPRGQGYRMLSADSLAGSKDAVETCGKLFAAKGGITAFMAGKKPFFTNILEYEDLVVNPEILNFVLSDAVVESVTAYLGTVPRLNSLGLFVSDANESLESSQLFHLDGEDFHMMKCFYNLDHVESENGPFTFLSSATTDRVREGLKTDLGSGRIKDDDVYRFCAPGDAIRLTGGAGTGAFVDTANCLHFGSRARAGHRIVLMFCYSPHPNIKISKGKSYLPGMPVQDFPLEPYAADPLRRMLLGVDA